MNVFWQHFISTPHVKFHKIIFFFGMKAKLNDWQTYLTCILLFFHSQYIHTLLSCLITVPSSKSWKVFKNTVISFVTTILQLLSTILQKTSWNPATGKMPYTYITIIKIINILFKIFKACMRYDNLLVIYKPMQESRMKIINLQNCIHYQKSACVFHMNSVTIHILHDYDDICLHFCLSKQNYPYNCRHSPCTSIHTHSCCSIQL